VVLAWVGVAAAVAELEEVRLESRVSGVQPMTGLVLWSTHESVATEAVQLEFAYLKYSELVSQRGRYDWSALEELLAAAAARHHQLILRMHFVYPGREAGVPEYIRQLAGYRETRALSEGKLTGFCDWSHPDLQAFLFEFHSEFAKRYDQDRRLAFYQTGFGLWAEYHIYDGPMELGKTFPDLALQERFARHLAGVFKHLPWSISVDAASRTAAPFAASPQLLALNFGVFDDSFLCKKHAQENAKNWQALDPLRWQRAPAGGEFSYFSKRDQKLALAANGPHGVPFEKAAADFHLTYIIANDQPEHASLKRMREAGLALGYRFAITRLASAPGRSELTLTNRGIAPLYCDAFPAVNGIRSTTTLKGLLPGATLAIVIPAGGPDPRVTIECDRLVPGQRIEFDAALE